MTAAEDRYRAGDCTACGEPLDDVSLAEGFERCGICDASAPRYVIEDRFGREVFRSPAAGGAS